MDPRTQDASNYYVWKVAGKPVVVHLSLNVVDDLLAEIMRGYGAMPKRAAEKGGLLLGAIKQGAQTIVRIDDFKPVACSYKRGPSYQFTDEDTAAFDKTFAANRPGTSSPSYAVGFYRSHTRDGMSLSEEDVELLHHYFPAPSNVALIVKPFATKTSVGGFFIREGGVFPPKTLLEFPFKSSELVEDVPPPPPPKPAVRMSTKVEPQPAAAAPPSYAVSRERGPSLSLHDVPSPSSRPSRGWTWPFSLVFLLVGILLGLLLAPLVISREAAAGPAAYDLNLAVTPAGDNLNVKWNRDAPAIKVAQRGVLEIEDGGFSQPQDLDASHLQTGSVVYKKSSSGSVKFRLTVYVNGRVTVTEMTEWRP